MCLCSVPMCDLVLLESEERTRGETSSTTRIVPVPYRRMAVSLPRRGGGRGGRGHGRGGHPFLGRERNPKLVSNSSNITLAASVSSLPPAPGSLPFYQCCRRPLSHFPRHCPPSLCTCWSPNWNEPRTDSGIPKFGILTDTNSGIPEPIWGLPFWCFFSHAQDRPFLAEN